MLRTGSRSVPAIFARFTGPRPVLRRFRSDRHHGRLGARHSSQGADDHERTVRGDSRTCNSALEDLGDATLRSKHGFPGDRESFEADLQRALEASSDTNLNAVAAVIVDYRGRVHLYQDPDFEIAEEGVDLAARLKRETQGR